MSAPSYGDVTAEYLALRTEAAVVRPGHEIVWVAGPDAVSFLDGLLSQHIAGMPVGSVSRSFLLDPRGKIASLLWVLRGTDLVGLVSDPGQGESLSAALARFRFRVDAAIEAGEPMAETWGPESGAALSGIGVDAPPGWALIEGSLVVALPLGPLPRFLVAEPIAARLESAGIRKAGTLASTTVRIEAGEPLTGVDVDEGTIPQETGLVVSAVSFTKGCYLGQELVARIDSRGRVNRHLRSVKLAENVIPPVGAVVVSGDLEAGVLTSVGESLALRAPVGMALLRREVEPGDRVLVQWAGGTAQATVEEVPLDDFSAA
ncbi:MAG: hypothetical protein MUP76_01090 [Acidimicrobiia bacterium]|nr:hypothetical protein [Acidimicrobiia bacterium]